MIETKAIIEAPIGVVSEILFDFKAYPEWNPFIIKLVGNPVEKQQIHVDILLPGSTDPNHFDPHVLVKNDAEFRWLGLLGCACCFAGEHYFLLKQVEANRTEFTHGEEFSGCLRALFACLMQGKTLEGFEAMNQALKKRCEERGKK